MTATSSPILRQWWWRNQYLQCWWMMIPPLLTFTHSHVLGHCKCYLSVVKSVWMLHAVIGCFILKGYKWNWSPYIRPYDWEKISGEVEDGKARMLCWDFLQQKFVINNSLLLWCGMFSFWSLFQFYHPLVLKHIAPRLSRIVLNSIDSYQIWLLKT